MWPFSRLCQPNARRCWLRLVKRKYRIKPPSPFRRFNSSPEAIRLLVMIYVMYLLSLQNVEDLLLERDSDLCHETVWHWWNRFGRLFAAEHPAPAREPDEELPPVTLAPRRNVREAGRRDGLPVAHGRLGKRNPRERRDEKARSRRCPGLHEKSTAVPRIASGDQHRWAALPTVPQWTNWVTAKSARPDAERPTGSRTAPAVPTTRSGLSFGSDNCRRYKNPPRSTPTSTTILIRSATSSIDRTTRNAARSHFPKGNHSWAKPWLSWPETHRVKTNSQWTGSAATQFLHHSMITGQHATAP